MKSRPWLGSMVAAIGLAASILTLITPAQAAKRVALVIGNNDYKNVPKLQKAVNDARTMGDTLKQLGFSVMVAENLNRQAFSETLLAFDRAVLSTCAPSPISFCTMRYSSPAAVIGIFKSWIPEMLPTA